MYHILNDKNTKSITENNSTQNYDGTRFSQIRQIL